MKLQGADDIMVIDFEASGLHSTSYPVEVGWCGFDMKAHSILIKPLPEWLQTPWSDEAEKIHGISRERLAGEGCDPVQVAHLLNDAARGKLVVSDAPEFDGHWLNRLFSGCAVKCEFHLRHIGEVKQACYDLVKPAASFDDWEELLDREDQARALFPHTHRAGEDALGMMAQIRAVLDKEWLKARQMERLQPA